MWCRGALTRWGIKTVWFGLQALSLLPLLFFAAGSVGAATTVKITTPGNGSTVTASVFNINVEYSLPETGGAISLEVSSVAGSYIHRASKFLSSASGTVSFSVDFSGMPSDSGWAALFEPGPKRITATLYSPPKPQTDPSGKYAAPSARILYGSDTVVFNYNPPVASPKPSPTPTSAPAAIYVYSDPHPAQIWINGTYRTDTTSSGSPVGFTDLKPGTYLVEIKKEGFIDYKESVTLAANQIRDVRAKLQSGTTPTGSIKINSDPTGVTVFLNGNKLTTAPTTIPGVKPGSYQLTLKKEGYEDWNETITVVAGKITEVNASLPPISSGVDPVPIAIGGAAAVAVGLGLKSLIARGKVAPVKTVPQAAGTDFYKQWWDKASPAERKSWDSFDQYLTKRLGPARLSGYQNVNGNASWSSAYESWQKELKTGQTKSTFQDWVSQHEAGEKQIKGMWERQQEFDEAEKKRQLAKNQQLLQKLDQMGQLEAFADHPGILEFYQKASQMVVDSTGRVNEEKLNRMWDIMKRWQVKEQFKPQVVEYTMDDFYWDTGSLTGRVALGAVTGGWSEAVFVPLSAVSRMQAGAAAGESNKEAIINGFKQGIFELAVGEGIGRGISYGVGKAVSKFPILNKPISLKLGNASPSLAPVTKSVKLGEVNPELAADMNAFKNMVEGVEDISKYNRDLLVKSRGVVKVGKTLSPELDPLEKQALKYAERHGKELANNAKLLPEEFKKVLGSGKQKVFESARERATQNVIKQMQDDGIKLEGKTFVGQDTGSHAQVGNPAYDAAASDFDQTVGFGGPKYNRLYEDRFKLYVEEQGISPKTLQGNVYGAGTSSEGAYTGAGKKFVEHYNQTTGSDIMVRVEKGQTIISRETPQVNNSNLSMGKSEIPGLNKNYTEGFTKKLNETAGIHGDAAKDAANIPQSLKEVIRDPKKLDAVLNQGSKEVSRTAGVHGGDSIKYYRDTGHVAGYKPPPAAQVADLVKDKGVSIEEAMRQVGYGGDKLQLLTDFMKILGL